MLLRQKIKPPDQRPDAVKKAVPAALKSGQYPLCVISQPFGSGKTVFISRYVREHGVQVLWYNLDSTDNQSICFWNTWSICSPRYQVGIPSGE